MLSAGRPPSMSKGQLVNTSSGAAAWRLLRVDAAETESEQMPAADVPNSYTEAVRSPQAKQWLVAMRKEMEKLQANGTYTLVGLPPGKVKIPCRWVFSVKRDGTYKARLVAKGFMQREGVDYEEVFAPTARMTSLPPAAPCRSHPA